MQLLYGYWAVMCANLILPIHENYNLQCSSCRQRADLAGETLSYVSDKSRQLIAYFSGIVIHIKYLETVMYCADFAF